MRAKRRNNGESGFALLLVFLMAAVIAITMYMEIPRVAFASQRQKEQLLMERGEQYKMAIQRFCQANNNRWPAKIEDLENFNNRRFLRHRYIDPMTGKDEWRLIHIQNGVLTDSVNTKPQNKDDKDKKGASEGYLAEVAGLGTAPLPGQGATGANAALRRRPSDGGTPGTDPATGLPVIPGQNQLLPPGSTGGPATTVPPTPTGAPGINAGTLPPGLPVPPTLNNNNGTPPNPTGGLVGTNGLGGQPSNPTGQAGVYAGQTQLPGMPGNPANSQTGGVSPYQTTAGANGVPPGFPQPGTNINSGAQPGQSNQAIGMINQILTSPRPGGLAGIQAANGAQPTTIGGGIAGFASTLDADSIMVYNDHTNYSQWEFVFDPTKFRKPPPPNGGLVGTAISSIGSMPTGGPGGTPVTSMAPGGNMNGGSMPGPGGAFGQSTQTGQQPGQQQGQQSGLSSAFGGGQPDIRPGRR
ncbi:MAG TPA: type II secretion system protein [Candidatus Limnocylindrales bacterium]|nr:type II secretion system protein [Candidatus Limnocylindrales bacterium]